MYNRKLYITDLNTDMSYQSPVKEAQVKKIVKHFDPQKLHTIVVNKRENGQFYIIDGQHRVQALKELGIPVVDATVHEGLSHAKEAEMYYGINDRPAKSPNSKGKSKLQFNDLEALEIEEAVTSAGLKIDYDKNLRTNGYITAYAALQSIHKQYGKDFLEVLLLTIRRAFGTESRCYQAFILRGFANFIGKYGRQIDFNHLINRLNELGFESFIQETNKHKATFNTKKECLPIALIDIYNKRKHKKNQLNKRMLFI